MHIYYQAAAAPETLDRHVIVLRVWNVDFAAFDPSVLTAGTGHDLIDEIQANRTELTDLARGAGLPPTEPNWRYIDGGLYERPDGTVWTPTANSDTSNLEDHAAADEARLNEIRDLPNDATLTDVRRATKDLAAILERVHRVVLRTLEEQQ
jgi:hypothetical protein